ncbi:hypothetical protein KJB62_07260 [Staphylococcus saprophyticus]|uniref:hypothetical protein n=1 Tax=Staphylococcus saprophyticus TaxID=29385 RepID=UPI001F2DC60D|nr:hypothetical protein [Staphylococcus saprophyticus]MCE5131187.1 hypothetical protein [Staphylococcus saprophyticus]
MKLVYFFDDKGYSNGENDYISPDEQGNYNLPNNATDIKPSNSLYTPIKFDGEKWIGTSKEQWQKENPVEDNNELPPTQNNGVGTDEELRKMFASMQVQLVQSNMMVMQLSQQNAQLSQQLVKLNQEIETLKGENSDETTIS